jgi:hypothetical protein
MKKILSIIVLLTVFSACTKDLTKYNVDPKSPTTVPSYAVFTYAQRILSNTLTSSNVNLNIFRLIEQQWEETTYTDESNYDLTTRTIPDFAWNALYRDVLGNLSQSKKLIPTDVTDAAMQKNELAIIDIMQVYTYYYLVTTFCNVPYSEASDINKPFPKFDDAKTIYYDLLTRLDADVAALNTSGASFGTADIIYSGDPAAWKKFANTLKLKMGITIADFDDAKAKTVVAAAVTAGVFTTNDDNALFKYQSASPNTNPVWIDLVQSGRQDFVAATTVMNLLQPAALGADPRLPYYFTTNASGVYAGAAPGASATFSLFSKPSGPLLVKGSIGSITNPDFPGLLLDYAETEFNLAEAVSRGYITTGTIQTHYLAGITASVTYWGGTSAQATAYELQTNVAYATAAGTTALQKIGVQKYLALYNRGWDAWIETRRLDVPAMATPVDAQSAFPVRFTYPINEQNVNVTNYNQASAAIGGDLVTTKLFFDKFTAPH